MNLFSTPIGRVAQRRQKMRKDKFMADSHKYG